MGNAHDVRQVQLALSIRRLQPLERPEQKVRVDTVHTDVDLTDRALQLRAVAVLDNAGYATLPVAHDAPKAGRIGNGFGEQRYCRTRPLVRRDQAPKAF